MDTEREKRGRPGIFSVSKIRTAHIVPDHRILKILKDLKDAKNFRRLGKEIHGRQQHFVEEEDLRSQGCPRTGRLVPGKILISAPLNGLAPHSFLDGRTTWSECPLPLRNYELHLRMSPGMPAKCCIDC